MKLPWNNFISYCLGALCGVAIFFVVAVGVNAAQDPINSTSAIPDLKLQVPFHGLGAIPGITVKDGEVTAPALATYLGQFYSWLITAVAIVAVVILMAGGMLYVTSRGDAGNVKKAQKMISNAIIGLGLTLGSYLILYTINPTLVQLPSLQLTQVKKAPLDIAQFKSFDQFKADSTSANLETITGKKCTGAMNWHGMYSGLTASDVDAILSRNGSPMAGSGSQIIAASTQYNIDPVFGLAFWFHESGLGKLGVATQTKNPGNVTASQGEVAAGKGCFVKDRNWLCYSDWASGAADWFRYINLYSEQQYQTVAGIIQPYAPPNENDVKAYIDSTCSTMIQWAHPDKQEDIRKQCGCS